MVVDLEGTHRPFEGFYEAIAPIRLGPVRIGKLERAGLRLCHDVGLDPTLPHRRHRDRDSHGSVIGTFLFLGRIQRRSRVFEGWRIPPRDLEIQERHVRSDDAKLHTAAQEW